MTILQQPTRRALLATTVTGVGSLLSLPLQAVTSSKSLAIMFMAGGGGGGGGTSGNFPGQTGNPVGFASAPGYPGSLTPISGNVSTNGTTYSFRDWDAGTGGTLISGNNNTFIGCRFQSNQTGFYNIRVTGTGNSFQYCSIVPRVALVGTTPPGAAWPSAGAGLQTTTFVTGTNCISGANGYQYGVFIDSGSQTATMDHCDIWGFANAIDWLSTTGQWTITDCWVHDARNASLGDHTDGPGYLNGATVPQNITIDHCTIASIGNTNALAFQGGTGTYNNILINNNFLSGFSATAFLFADNIGGSVLANSRFTNNIFGTDLPWSNNAIYTGGAVTVLDQFSGVTNVWTVNKLRVLAGTAPLGGTSPNWNSGQDGFYFWPDNTLHSTEWVHP